MSTKWNHRRMNHPMRPLGDSFASYIQHSDRSVPVRANGQTITFGPKPGRQVALRLRIDGLHLVATRNGVELVLILNSEAQFAAGRDFVREHTR